MYYDVVCSVYEKETSNRVDSHLICGGFDSEEEARGYIQSHDCEKECLNAHNEKLYRCTEIEERDEGGNLVAIC